MGTSPSNLIIFFKLRYSGLKSCPHSDIQCASSMATKEIFSFFKKEIYSSLVSDSGATYSSLVNPDDMSFLTWAISVLFNEEFKTCAIPYSDDKLRIAST